MKCEGLKTETIVPQGTAITLQMYPKGEVEEAIAELKARIHELESMPHTDNSAVIERLSNENERLKAKLESVQATAYTESVDAGMENRRLKRALWMARAERALAESYSVLNDVRTANKWSKILNKLKAKANEYK